MPPLRVFLSGRSAVETDALRRRLAGNENIVIVDRLEDAEAVLTTRPPGRPREPVVEELTSRERDVLTLLADGLANREIAAALAISEHTVKFHLASIFGKLGATTRTDAVQRGLRLGVIDI